MPEDSRADESSGLNEDDNSAARSQSAGAKEPAHEAETSEVPQSDQTNDVDALEKRRKKAPPVDRTKLDVDAVRDMATSAKEERETKLREELESRPVQPFKQFQAIESYRKASPCSSICKAGEKLERVTSCERCNLRVYDFKEMEQPEAEELVFKMEGRRNVLLYKRRDGKFLTEDCPVGLKDRQNRAILTTGAAAFFIAVVSLSFVMPKPAPQPVPVAVAKKADISSASLSKQTTAVKSSRGWLARTASQGASQAASQAASQVTSPGASPFRSKTPASPMSQEYAAWGGLDTKTAFSPPAQGEVGFVQPAVGGAVEQGGTTSPQPASGISPAPATGSQPSPVQAPAGSVP